MTKKRNNTVTLEEFITTKKGVRGTSSRDKFEAGYEIFKLGIMLQEMRRKKNLTQQQLADKCGTTKTYISRIENDASDIRLSTLTRIIEKGLGAHLRLSVSY